MAAKIIDLTADDGQNGKKRKADASAGHPKRAAPPIDYSVIDEAEQKYRAAQCHYFFMQEYERNRPGPTLCDAAGAIGLDAAAMMPATDLDAWRRIVAHHLADWQRKHAQLMAVVGGKSRVADAVVFQTWQAYNDFWDLNLQ